MHLKVIIIMYLLSHLMRMMTLKKQEKDRKVLRE